MQLFVICCIAKLGLGLSFPQGSSCEDIKGWLELVYKYFKYICYCVYVYTRVTHTHTYIYIYMCVCVCVCVCVCYSLELWES